MADRETPAFITPEHAKIINEAIQAKKIMPQCPMCESRTFSIADGYFAHPASRNIAEVFELTGDKTFFLSIALICGNCGHMAFLSLDKLGIMHIFTGAADPRKDAAHE